MTRRWANKQIDLKRKMQRTSSYTHVRTYVQNNKCEHELYNQPTTISLPQGRHGLLSIHFSHDLRTTTNTISLAKPLFISFVCLSCLSVCLPACLPACLSDLFLRSKVLLKVKVCLHGQIFKLARENECFPTPR